MVSVDLNADLGESFGAYQMPGEEELLAYVTSANIACGFHAGDPGTMRKTVRCAMERQVAIGAHPGYPDLVGFGRRRMDASPQEVYDMTVYQIGALAAFVRSEGGTLHHVKPHGALYNTAAVNAPIAEAIAEAVYRVDPGLILYGLAGSELIRAAERIGLQAASEAFADRTYQADGTLTPRSNSNALLHDADAAVAQVLTMVKDGTVISAQGTSVQVTADTICLHGDGPDAVRFAQKLRAALASERIWVAAVERA